MAELQAKHPRIKTINLDLSDWNNTREQLEKHFKDVKIHGLVNNAAIAICKPVSELTEKDFDEYAKLKLIYTKMYKECSELQDYERECEICV